MVEVEKYIKRLLYDQDCVIIPEFGGVLTHYLPARFDAASGRYLPSQRKVAFNEVLKLDDGLLAQFISQNEGMPYEQAQRHVQDFVRTVQTLIRKNKTVALSGVGSFQLNPEGRILFLPDQSRNFHAGFYGLQPVPTHERVPVSTALVTAESMPEEASELLVISPPARRFAWGNWISAAGIACILVYVSAVLSNEPGATSSLNPFETVRTLFRGSPPTVELAPEELPALPAEVTPNEGFAVEDKVEPNVALAEVVEEKPALTYHVIASVYESRLSLEKYGEQMAGRLRESGYETVEMLTVRDKYMLSAGAYATWNEAQRALPKLNKTAKGAWIYRRR